MSRFFASLLIVLSLGIFVACGDDDDNGDTTPTTAAESPAATATEPAPTHTPAPTDTPAAPETPTPSASDCPLPVAVCEQALQLEEWLESEDYDAIVAATQTEQYTCPDEQPDGPGGPFPLCDGAPGGEERSGIAIARRYSEGAIVSADGYRTGLQGFTASADADASDDYGDGGLDLIAASCSNAAEAPEDCTESVVIFSAILSGAGNNPDVREVLLFWLPTEDLDSETPIETTWTGILLDDEPEVIFGGGTLFDIGRVFPLE